MDFGVVNQTNFSFVLAVSFEEIVGFEEVLCLGEAVSFEEDLYFEEIVSFEEDLKVVDALAFLVTQNCFLQLDWFLEPVEKITVLLVVWNS